jgi:hypothetical protein
MRLREIALLLLVLSGLSICFAPRLAPILSAAALATAAVPWFQAWTAARGTALRPALVWAALALGLMGVAQLVAVTEPVAAGRPRAGRRTYK